MGLDHDTAMWFQQSIGLFYLVAFAIAVVVYAYWPSNRSRFDAAAHSILNDDEDKPWK
jgi:cytochrome c oxidase cbb3-type subunit 4